YPGEQGGKSIAEILFGEINPSGRIPVSFPRSVGHLPCYYNHLPTDKGYYKKRGAYGKPGRDYVFSDPAALWTFGYGLGYTTFSYDRVELDNKRLSFNDNLMVSVDVSNTGKREGKETVQLYIRQEYCSIVRPIKELKAFKKVSIEPGETKQVSFKLVLKDWGYYNNKGEYLLEAGRFFVMVGSSADDIKFKKVIEIL
ncbi:MAG: glycosyl hydrolase, partial [Bacteroidetes bacterium]